MRERSAARIGRRCLSLRRSIDAGGVERRATRNVWPSKMPDTTEDPCASHLLRRRLLPARATTGPIVLVEWQELAIPYHLGPGPARPI